MSTVNPTTQWFSRACLVAAVLVLSTACGGLLKNDKPPLQEWWLEPLDNGATAAASDDARGLAIEVTAVPGLDSDRILTLDADARLNHYAGARWADHLPELLESLISRTLESTGKFSSVVENRHARAGDCLLRLEARRFYSRLNSAGDSMSVEIELAGQFTCDGNARAVNAAASIPVNGTHMTTIVAAYQSGLNKVLGEGSTSLQPEHGQRVRPDRDQSN